MLHQRIQLCALILHTRFRGSIRLRQIRYSGFSPLPVIFLFLQCLPAIGGRRFTGSWEEGPIRTPDGWPAQRLVTTTQFSKMACAIPFRENSRSPIIPSFDTENLDTCPESCYDAHKTITPEVLLSVRSSDFIDGSNSDLIDSCAGIKPIGTFPVDGSKDLFLLLSLHTGS